MPKRGYIGDGPVSEFLASRASGSTSPGCGLEFRLP